MILLGDSMQQLLWELFQKTGDIKYYLLVKRIESEIDGSKKNRGTRSK